MAQLHSQAQRQTRVQPPDPTYILRSESKIEHAQAGPLRLDADIPYQTGQHIP